MADRFDKFTERARTVLKMAQEEAQHFDHNYIGTEHLLLGLVHEGDGIAAGVLANLGVELDRVRSAVEFIIGRGDRAVLGEIGLTPRAKRVIELAVDEARRLNHQYIGTEHLLLGLVREGEGIAAGVLESQGVNLERVRAETTRILSSSMPQGQRIERPYLPQLGSLRNEVEVERSLRHSGIRLRFHALQVYRFGFIATLSIGPDGRRPLEPPQPESAHASLIVIDAERRRYETQAEEGRWEDGEWHMSFRGAPTLLPARRDLLFWFPDLRWRSREGGADVDRPIEGFWTFQLTL